MADDLRAKVSGVFNDPKYGRDPEWLRVNVLGMIGQHAAEVERLTTERDAAQEHAAYHLQDFRPLADGNMTGDLAVDMAAYAGRLKAGRDAAVREAAALRAGVEALTYASDDGTQYQHNGHPVFEGEPECPRCWADSLRALLAEHPTPEVDRA